MEILKNLYEVKLNRSKRSQESVENSKPTSSESEENNLPCNTEDEGMMRVREEISRVALAHLLAWPQIYTESRKNKDSMKIQKFYQEINHNAGELDPLAGILSRHLSKGAELYYKDLK